MMNMIVEEVMNLTGCFWPEAHSNSTSGQTSAELSVCGFENYGVLCV
jgi:hypothetical protein